MMRFGTYHTFQHPPWIAEPDVYRLEMDRLEMADRMGYDEVWIPEQHFTPYCLTGDPFVLVTHAAGRTKRVRIGIAVVNLSFAHPLRLAEQGAIVDILTGGRVDIGIGRGYQPIQYPVFGVSMEDTRERFDETLNVLTRAWTEERFSHQGKFHHFPDVSVLPKPISKPHVPLLMASSTKDSAIIAAKKRMPAILARPFNDNKTVADDIALYTQCLREASATPQEVTSLLNQSVVMKLMYVAPTNKASKDEPYEALKWHVDILHRITIDPSKAPKSYEQMADRFKKRGDFDYDEWWQNRLIYGDPDRCAEQVVELAKAGVKRLLLWHGPGGVDHEKLVRSMKLFIEQVKPQVMKALRS